VKCFFIWFQKVVLFLKCKKNCWKAAANALRAEKPQLQPKCVSADVLSMPKAKLPPSPVPNPPKIETPPNVYGHFFAANASWFLFFAYSLIFFIFYLENYTMKYISTRISNS
jgi:hypothetical protein